MEEPTAATVVGGVNNSAVCKWNRLLLPQRNCLPLQLRLQLLFEEPTMATPQLQFSRLAGSSCCGGTANDRRFSHLGQDLARLSRGPGRSAVGRLSKFAGCRLAGPTSLLRASAALSSAHTGRVALERRGPRQPRPVGPGQFDGRPKSAARRGEQQGPQRPAGAPQRNKRRRGGGTDPAGRRRARGRRQPGGRGAGARRFRQRHSAESLLIGVSPSQETLEYWRPAAAKPAGPRAVSRPGG